ncbi:hypothetical protein ACFX15_018317 [Malus domestica]
MKLGFPGPPVLMEKKNFLIALSFVAKVEMNCPLYFFCKVYGFSSLTCKINTTASRWAYQNYVRYKGISSEDVPWLTSTQLPERLAPIDIVCRASAYWRAIREGHS